MSEILVIIFRISTLRFSYNEKDRIDEIEYDKIRSVEKRKNYPEKE